MSLRSLVGEKVSITEVGPRDGLQNESKFIDIEDKIRLIHLLENSGIRHMEVTSFVRPDRINQFTDASVLLSRLEPNSRYISLVPNLQGLQSALMVQSKAIAVFTAVSETFNKKNINATLEEAKKRILEVTKEALPRGLFIRGHISTVFGCPYEGKTSLDQLLKTCDWLLESGVQEIALGDTIGVANPTQVEEILEALNSRFPIFTFSLHFHDTEGSALANIIAGLLGGVRKFDSSVGGLGGCPYAKGASGNVATEDVVNLLHKMGMKTGIDLDSLLEASRFILNKVEKLGPKSFLAIEGRKKK